MKNRRIDPDRTICWATKIRHCNSAFQCSPYSGANYCLLRKSNGGSWAWRSEKRFQESKIILILIWTRFGLFCFLKTCHRTCSLFKRPVSSKETKDRFFWWVENLDRFQDRFSPARFFNRKTGQAFSSGIKETCSILLSKIALKIPVL